MQDATAQEILDAEADLRSRLHAHCTDATVASLATVASFEGCDVTVDGRQQCLVADHWDHVQHVLDQQYGTLVPTDDPGVQHCQTAIAQAGKHPLVAHVQAMAHCLTNHSAHGARRDLAQRCIGQVVHGQFIAPTDPWTALQLRLAVRSTRHRFC